MRRSDFLRKCAILGIAAPFLPQLIGCGKEDELVVNFDGKVIIVGAGSAGLMAGYMLQRYGIDFQILEASSTFGGRMKKAEGFADFPIDLGAEWIHTSPTIFARLINDDEADGNVELIPYNPASISTWNNGKLRSQNWASTFYGEYKFKKTTWLDFFGDYIVPSIQNKIIYNKVVSEIDYSLDQVVLKTTDGDSYTAEKTLITIPIKMLQQNSIEFIPQLPSDKIEAINKVDYPPGIKVFIEFSKRFYPDMLVVGPLIGGSGEQLYYDAAFKKDSSRNIMALFYVGDNANEFTDLPNDSAIIDKVLNQLDEIFDGKASQYYIKHITQNWSKEPYIQGSYSHYGSDESAIKNILRQALNNKVYFAGEAIEENDSSTVHGAGLSAYEAIEGILRGD